MSIDYTLDDIDSILHVRPTGALHSEDFETLSEAVDPYIERTGGLRGLIIEVERFPGWNGIGAAIKHMRFIRGHHRRIAKVAVVTDSRLGDVAEKIASYFVSARIEHFPSGRVEEAKYWIKSD